MERELAAEAQELEQNPRRKKTRTKTRKRTRKRTMRKKSERTMRKAQALELEQAKDQQALELEQPKEQQALELKAPRVDTRAFPRQERRPRSQNGSPPKHENTPRK